MSESGRLAGRVAWVNGGAGAVGVACCIELARAGARVVMSGRNAAGLDKAIGEAGGGNIESLLVDVSRSQSVREGAAEIEKRHGRIDIVVNSAGINPSKRHWDDLTAEDWDETVNVNLNGMFYACQAAMRGMRERRNGVIVNIGSWAGRFAAYFAGPAYSATKRAVLALTETINMEECVNGIRATSISPAGIDTPFLDKRPKPPSAETRAGLLKPKDIADVCVYVASLPPHVCINEILMSPVLNSAYLGELETRKRRP
jgi:NAD(P)-dependent dehydrogenase (short-subunit alcohol dehydrogenase family)